MQNDVVNLLSARTGHFRLESGHHGNLWLNLDATFLRPHALTPLAQELARQLSAYHPQAVCGPLLGGALLAYTVAAVLDVEFYVTERFVVPQSEGLYPVEYRLPAATANNIRGKNVVIVDDVINAGSAVRGTMAAIRSHDAIPVAVGALLVLGSTATRIFAEHNLPLLSLAQLSSELWIPSDCPLCAAGIPLENLTT